MRGHHCNLASFIGYCNEGTNIGIVYEYVAGGNLEQCLLDKRNEALSWKDRLQIALDAAQGLQYLHQGSSSQRCKEFKYFVRRKTAGQDCRFWALKAFPQVKVGVICLLRLLALLDMLILSQVD